MTVSLAVCPWRSVLGWGNTSISGELNMTSFVPYGLLVGVTCGLFGGIFWFEMGLSLLVGTVTGVFIGAVVDSVLKKDAKLDRDDKKAPSA